MDGKNRRSKVKSKSKDKVDLKKLFRFQSFSERIAKVRIDVSHRIGHTTDSPEDRETFFSEALQKWIQLNCTSDFISFEREVRNKVDSLAQLVYHKDDIVSKLKDRLLVKNTPAYEPLLDLLVQFARDIQSEFYPYFKKLFPVLVALCDCQDAELIQCVFTTLAYLLKFLWRLMLKDLGNVFSLYSDLLSSSQQPHIQRFAVESFGFLLRKVRDLEGLVDMIFTQVTISSELSDGVGQLLFEVCKGVPKQFHSCTENLLPILLGQLGSPLYSPSPVLQTLTKLMQLMAEHTNAQFSTPIWNSLLAHLDQVQSSCDWSDQGDQVTLSHTLHLIGVMVSWRNGTRVPAKIGTQIFNAVLKLLQKSHLPREVLVVVTQLAGSLILVNSNIHLYALHDEVVRLVSGVCSSSRNVDAEDVEIVLNFLRELAQKYSGFEYDILPACFQYLESALKHDTNLIPILKFLCELCFHFDPTSSSVSHNDIINLARPSFVLDLTSVQLNQARSTRSRQATTKPNIVRQLELLLDSGLTVEWCTIDEKESEMQDKINLLWAALVCLKYIRPVESSCLAKLQQLISILKDSLCQPTVVESTRQNTSSQLFLFSQCLSTFVTCFNNSSEKERKDFSIPSPSCVLDLLKNYPSSLALLRSAYQYLDLVGEDLTSERLAELLSVLLRNLSSPSSSVRLVTLRLLGCFDLSNSTSTKLESEDGSQGPLVDAVEVCLQAEEIPAHLHTYRDKLLWLQRLKYGNNKFKLVPEFQDNPCQIPLHYLIGMLYVNFSLLWEPVCEIIRSYAVNDCKKLFWEVFRSYLEEASFMTEDQSSPSSSWRPSVDVGQTSWHESLSSLFQYQGEVMDHLQRGRPDIANFRILLWKCVSGFNTEFSESRSRILVPLLLRFTQKEFSLKENNLLESQDLRRTSDDVSDSSSELEENVGGREDMIEEMDTTAITADVATEEDDKKKEEDEEAEEETLHSDGEEMERESSSSEAEMESKPSFTHRRRGKTEANKTKRLSGNVLTKTLTVMLTVFSKFHNPKSFYQEKELRQLYMKLLTHYDSEIQKLALHCLLTYKPPYLLPYRENFELLLDDTSFREELSNFSMDSECSIVEAEHREELLPVLVRVLYGCMQKTGGVGSSKFGKTPKRGTVLRFFGGCEGNEMTEFINLLILPFKSLLSASDSSHVASFATKVDVSSVIPLKKQQGFLNMFGQMVSILGSKLETQLPVLFQITVRLGSFCAQLLEQRDQIQPHFVNALKILRQMVVHRITECYGKFTEFDFSPYQEEVFSAVVWPQVTKLPHECIQSPTPLMKLFLTWSGHPQYHSLLGVPIPNSIVDTPNSGSSDDERTTENSSLILYYICGCLSAPKVSASVHHCVMELVINLLDSVDNLNIEQEAAARSSKTVKRDQIKNRGGIEIEASSSAIGHRLVLLIISQLLNYMSTLIESEARRIKSGSDQRNLHLEFKVISKASQFVNDPSTAAQLIQLLLPFLLNQSEKYKKYEEDVLMAVVNLTGLVEKFTDFYRPISELLGIICNRQSRTLLCKVFEVLSEKADHLKITASIIQKLNSWDRGHVDEPNYTLRLEGFSDAKQLLASVGESISSDMCLILPILHNALFFLSQCEDMSIRDAAASFVADLINQIKPQDGDAFQLLILTTIVTAVKKGLRSKMEFARLEFISVLSQLVKAYPNHPKFSPMVPLSHHEPEADFFENVKHIQLHRRTRAFRKLAGLCGEGTLTSECTMTFILPLANHVVFTPVTNTEQNLVAEAVNVIGSISSRLSWSNYLFMLHHYLRQLPVRLDLQKTLIKVVVAVLDNFHFDLSSIQSSSHNDDRENDDITKATSTNQSHSDDEELPPDEGGSEEDKESSQEGLEMEEGDSEGIQKERESSAGGGEGESLKQLALAKKIHKAIVASILPSLEAVITKRVDVPGHKLSRLSHEQEGNSEILRVPVAMAITKLLLTLPEETLHTRLPSLLLKVCQTLKNRSRDVRDAGRNTLVKMACALGPKYLRYIVKEMKDMLNRGYMLHVLGYSLHSILKGLSSTSSSSSSPSPSLATSSPVSLKSSDLDACLDLISSILVEDLFGVPAEERESGENVAKIPESKTPQSHNCYEIVAQFLSPRLIPDLLAPVREVLESRSTSHVAHTVEEVCRRVSLGIQNNEGFTPQALLVFVYALLNDSIPQLSSKSTSKRQPSSADMSHDTVVDSRLIPPEPGRSNPKPISAGNVGASIITEFGLQLLHVGLKRGKFNLSSEEQLGMLDPFVPLLAKSLSSPNIKVLSRTLQCLVWIIRMPLPSLANHIDEISHHLFGLLRRYARAGSAVGSNRELVHSAFKAMTVLLRDFRKQGVSEDELTVLLSFVEEDIYDHQRQGTAFPLLKAILGRKLVCSEMFELMQKVCQLSVTSDSEHVRLQCRQCILQFILDYPLGKKLNRYLDFFIVNLSYEQQSGRESVIEQLSSMITKFPERLLNRHAIFFFVPLCCQILNEDSVMCKEMIAETLKILLRRVDTIRSNEIQEMIKSWFNNGKLSIKRLASLTLGLLVEVEGQSFEKRLSLFLPLLHNCLSLFDPQAPDSVPVEESATENAVSEQHDDIEEEDKGAGGDESTSDATGMENGITENVESEMDVEESAGGDDSEVPSKDYQGTSVGLLDRVLFSSLLTLRKICSECSVLRVSTHRETMNMIWEQVRVLLLHPHTWVRLTSSQLYGLLFACYTPDELVTVATQNKSVGGDTKRGKKKRAKTRQAVEQQEYLHQDTITKVQDLSYASCMQLSSPLLSTELANQSVKNLVYLGKVLHRCGIAGALVKQDVSDEQESDAGGMKRVRDLNWLVERLSRLAKFEAAHHPKESIKRTSVLQWTAAISMDLGAEHLPTHLPSLLRPVYREMADSNMTGGEDLHSLAQEVVDLMKGVCGKDAFSEAYAQVHQTVLSNREKRRQQAALQAVANPEKSIRRKQRKHQLKKLAKKRQLLFHRPTGTGAAATRKKLKLKYN